MNAHFSHCLNVFSFAAHSTATTNLHIKWSLKRFLINCSSVWWNVKNFQYCQMNFSSWILKNHSSSDFRPDHDDSRELKALQTTRSFVFFVRFNSHSCSRFWPRLKLKLLFITKTFSPSLIFSRCGKFLCLSKTFRNNNNIFPLLLFLLTFYGSMWFFPLQIHPKLRLTLQLCIPARHRKRRWAVSSMAKLNLK